MEMKQIRHSVFETNSSSSHSITLLALIKDFNSSDERKTTNYIITGRKISDYEVWGGDSYYDKEDNIYHVCGGEFGWQWFILKDFNAKCKEFSVFHNKYLLNSA